ncbi:MAG: HAD-IB family phosphatase [bacterium]
MLQRTQPIQHIIFDCDSTLTTLEGIDELAALVDKKEHISELTRKAMDGEVPLEGVFFERIDLIKPTYTQMVQVGRQYTRSLSNNAKMIFEIARYFGKSLYIFSAGYLASLEVLGDYLGLPRENVRAVDIIFDQQGDYLYCPRDQLLTWTDGKLRLVRHMNFPYNNTMMIGDGANDLSVQEGVDLFVGYQGEKENRFMRENARIFLQGDDLLPVISMMLTVEEKEQLAKTHYAQMVKQSEAMVKERVVVKK